VGNCGHLQKGGGDEAVVDERQTRTLTLLRIDYTIIVLWVRHLRRERKTTNPNLEYSALRNLS
jgi:hypothetical protein